MKPLAIDYPVTLVCERIIEIRSSSVLDRLPHHLRPTFVGINAVAGHQHVFPNSRTDGSAD